MNQLLRSRLRWGAVGGVAAVLGAGLLTVPADALQSVSAGASAPVATTQLAGFASAPAAVRVGGAVWDTATVLPGTARTVTVQYRRAGAKAFTNATTVRTSTGGAVSLDLQPPSAGTWQFRAVVARTASASRLVSRTRTVTATGRAAGTRVTGVMSGTTRVQVGATASDDLTITPGASRTVLLQAQRPGAARFVTVSSGRATRAGRFHAVWRPTAAGAWRFRLAIPASATARAATSASRPVTATPAPASTGTSASGTGAVTPAGSGGTATGSTPGGSTPGGIGSTDDGGITGGPAVPTTTTAAIAVRVPGYPHRAPMSKVTVGTPFEFDAAASVAAPGQTLVSGTVDYGDGESFDFTLPNGPLDYWNTLHSYATTGSMTVTLTVKDSAGTTDHATTTVQVYGAPSSSLQVSSGAATTSQPVTLALGTVTPDGTQAVSYSLEVHGDGTAADGSLTTVHYYVYGDEPPATRDLTLTMPGTYTVTYRLETDAGGYPDPATVTFDVAAG